MRRKQHEFTRRTALAFAGGVSATTFIGCDSDAPAGQGGDAALTDAGLGGDAGFGETGHTAAPCTLYPQQVEGPFFLPDDLLRQEITEGKPGTPLTLRLQVIRQGSCIAMPNVAVDVWHCDALGVYSGFPGQLQNMDTRGKTFLRGTQLTDARGDVEFRTIYPGWYPGRTTHIHFKVRPTASTAATSQLYFPESINALVYTQNAPYDSRPKKDTSNARDGANQLTDVPPLPTVQMAGEGYVAKFVVAIA